MSIKICTHTLVHRYAVNKQSWLECRTKSVDRLQHLSLFRETQYCAHFGLKLPQYVALFSWATTLETQSANGSWIWNTVVQGMQLLNFISARFNCISLSVYAMPPWRWSLLHSGKDSTALWEGCNCILCREGIHCILGRIQLHFGKDFMQCMLGRISLSDVELIKFNEQDAR